MDDIKIVIVMNVKRKQLLPLILRKLVAYTLKQYIVKKNAIAS